MKLGFIGLGIMGKPMAGHLLAAGHELFAQSRSGVPADLTSQGAKACTTPAQVAQQADIIFLMVPDTPHVQDVLFGENGLAHGLSAGKTVVDMSSISPMATKEFAARIQALGCDYIDGFGWRSGGQSRQPHHHVRRHRCVFRKGQAAV